MDWKQYNTSAKPPRTETGAYGGPVSQWYRKKETQFFLLEKNLYFSKSSQNVNAKKAKSIIMAAARSLSLSIPRGGNMKKKKKKRNAFLIRSPYSLLTLPQRGDFSKKFFEKCPKKNTQKIIIFGGQTMRKKKFFHIFHHLKRRGITDLSPRDVYNKLHTQRSSTTTLKRKIGPKAARPSSTSGDFVFQIWNPEEVPNVAAGRVKGTAD